MDLTRCLREILNEEAFILSHSLEGLTLTQLALLRQLIVVKGGCSPHGARKQTSQQRGQTGRGMGQDMFFKIQPWQPASFSWAPPLSMPTSFQ